MLIGHSADAAAPLGIAGQDSTSGDFEPEMLGGPQAAETLPMAESALSADSSAAPPHWSLSQAMDSGGTQSTFESPDEPFAFDSDESIVLPSSLSMAPDSSTGALSLADSAVDVDWSGPSTADSIASPTSSADGQGFETAGAASSMDASTAPQPDSTASHAQSDGRDSLSESATSASDKEPGMATLLTVTLTDREQLVAAAAAEIAALAKAAARTTAESVVDERLSSLRTQDDARQTSRAAIFGS
jgi:hypothetical protein